jgi:N-acetyl-gamma-glutamyl-phosphate reductase
MFPSLRRRVDLRFVDPQAADLAACDVVFFATPNGIAMQQAKALVDAGVKVIDLAADFRITDIAEWEKWYGMKHACPELVAEAVYGLPEVNRGCATRGWLRIRVLSTAVQLGFLPLVEAGWLSWGV